MGEIDYPARPSGMKEPGDPLVGFPGAIREAGNDKVKRLQHLIATITRSAKSAFGIDGEGCGL